MLYEVITVIDLWAQLLRRVAGIGSTDWALVGRWVSGLGRGRLQISADDIAHRRRGKAVPVRGDSYRLIVVCAKGSAEPRRTVEDKEILRLVGDRFAQFLLQPSLRSTRP